MEGQICRCLDSGCPVRKACSRFIEGNTSSHVWISDFRRKPSEECCDFFLTNNPFNHVEDQRFVALFRRWGCIRGGGLRGGISDELSQNAHTSEGCLLD